MINNLVKHQTSTCNGGEIKFKETRERHLLKYANFEQWLALVFFLIPKPFLKDNHAIAAGENNLNHITLWHCAKFKSV